MNNTTMTGIDIATMREVIIESFESPKFSEAVARAMLNHKRISTSIKRKKNPDLISSNEAFRLRGRARVEKLIKLGLLTRTSSGAGVNATRYVSKSRLLELDNVYL